MRVGFISIGTEIMLGDTLNTNGNSLAKALLTNGYQLLYELSVADKKKDIETALEFLTDNTNVLIISGGLGPTEDDMTKEYISLITNNKLIEDEEHTKWMQNIWNKRGLKMPELNRKQSYFFNNYNAIPNTSGTALGAHLNYKNTEIFLTPGPPREFSPMVNDYVIPRIKELYSKNLFEYKYLTIYGVPESNLSENINSFKPNSMELAYLPSYGIIKLRYDKQSITEDEESQFIDGLNTFYSENIISFSNKSLNKVVFDTLCNENKYLSLVESITGGMLSSLIVSIPGASKVLTESSVLYHNDQKLNFLKSNNLEHDWNILASLLSEECLSKSKASISLAVLGEAGPISSTNYKVGDVFISLSDCNKTTVERYSFTGNRIDIIKRASNQCLFNILKFLG